MLRASARWLAGVAAVAAGLLGPTMIGASAASAQTAPPPTLTGEQLAAQGQAGGVSCSSTGGGGSFSYTTSGTATGPYSGTFTETIGGTLTSDTTLGSLTATFTINSATGEVTGTKTWSGGAYSACYVNAGNFIITAAMNYRATIHTAAAAYTDQGTAQTSTEEIGGSPSLLENFTSSQTQPTPSEPTSKQQCMNGGYKNYSQFKNQGQCVAYVEHNQGGS